MYSPAPARGHQKQEIAAGSLHQLVGDSRNQGIAACEAQDRFALRSALAELRQNLSRLNSVDATPIEALIEYCLIESVNGDLSTVRDLLVAISEAWRGATPPCQE